MKKILFSLESLQNEKMKYHGGGKYGINILKLLLNDGVLVKNIIIFFDSNKLITDELKKIIQNKKIMKIDRKNHQNDQEIYNEINNKYDYIFTPIREEFFLSNKILIKKICPIHDVRFYELNPSLDSVRLEINTINKIKKLIWIYLKKYFINFFKRKENPLEQDYIITVSNYSKYSIVLTFPNIEKEKIKVLNPLLEKHTKILKGYKKIEGVEKNYFLLISANRWEKNCLRVIRNYDYLISNFECVNKKMIIVGMKQISLNLKNKDMFIFVDYVTDEELEALYKEAYCFIYPTLNEGFGYPPLEAMKYGTPVIASAVTSVSEVCKDAVEYINPYSDYEIKNKILYLIDNKNRYKELQELSKTHFDKFELNQEKLEKEYLNYFNELVTK